MFRADNLIALWERVPPAERLRYPFALHQINWEDYLFKTHFPGIRRCRLVSHQNRVPQDLLSTFACCIKPNLGILHRCLACPRGYYQGQSSLHPC